MRLEEIQLKLMEQSVEEAILKTEKARVELEPAKLQNEYAQKLLLNGVSAKGALQ